MKKKSKTRIKICGITSVEDALAVASLGAHEVGLNFYPSSPRYVDAEIARSIGAALPGYVMRVGVFVNTDIESVLSCREAVGLSSIQLHGDEDAGYIAELRRRTDSFLIKAIPADQMELILTISEGSVDAILIDSPAGILRGGTGETFDWSGLRPIKAAIPIYLAGGLSQNNVASAIREVRPYAVDACSRLESAPGRKDLTKVEDFIREASQAI